MRKRSSPTKKLILLQLYKRGTLLLILHEIAFILNENVKLNYYTYGENPSLKGAQHV